MRAPRSVGALAPVLVALAVMVVPADAQAPEASTPLTPLTPPAELVARLALADREDAYAFDASAGDLVSVRVSALDPIFDPVVELYGPDGRWLATDDDGGPGVDAALDLQVGEDGTYSTVVRSAGYGTSGRYRLSVGLERVTMLSQGSLGAALVRGATDTYAFAGRAGERVGVEMRSDFDGALQIVAPDGSGMAYDDGRLFGPRHPFTQALLPADGLYRVRASSPVGGGGQYVVSLITGGGIPLPSDGSMRLDTSTGADPVFSFEGAAGTIVRVRGASSDSSPSVALYGPDGDLVASSSAVQADPWGDEDAAAVLVRLPETGRYRVDAYLDACCDIEVGVSTPEVTLVDPPATLDAGLSSESEDIYVVSLRAGDTLTVSMSSQDLDSFLRVLTPGLAELGADDDSGGGPSGYDSWLTVTAPEDGLYPVITRDLQGSPGAYRISVSVTG